METKTQVKQVSLWRAEGKITEPVIYINANIQGNACEFHSRWKNAKHPAPDRWCKDIEKSVTDCLTRWGTTAPASGYDKTDFHIVFDNGFTYEGRFDLQYGGLDSGQTFFESLRHRMEFQADELHPEWASCTKDEWEQYTEGIRSVLETWN